MNSDKHDDFTPSQQPTTVDGLVAIYDAAFEKCDNDPDDRISPKWRAIEAVMRALEAALATQPQGVSHDDQ